MTHTVVNIKYLYVHMHVFSMCGYMTVEVLVVASLQICTFKGIEMYTMM